jgi:hypothetical protein
MLSLFRTYNWAGGSLILILNQGILLIVAHGESFGMPLCIAGSWLPVSLPLSLSHAFVSRSTARLS